MATTTSVPYSFTIGNADPVDRRLVLTKAEMKAMKVVKMPRSDITKYFALCSDNNQFYVYDRSISAEEAEASETGRFVLLSLPVDDNSVIQMTDGGLSIKGYSGATQGQMLVKDQTSGLAWVNPVTDTTLQEKVEQAAASATQAGTSAVTAGNYAAQAVAAKTAIENKLWYGTMAEYNALETVSASTIYFILDGSLNMNTEA